MKERTFRKTIRISRVRVQDPSLENHSLELVVGENDITEIVLDRERNNLEIYFINEGHGQTLNLDRVFSVTYERCSV